MHSDLAESSNITKVVRIGFRNIVAPGVITGILKTLVWSTSREMGAAFVAWRLGFIGNIADA